MTQKNELNFYDLLDVIRDAVLQARGGDVNVLNLFTAKKLLRKPC